MWVRACMRACVGVYMCVSVCVGVRACAVCVLAIVCAYAYSACLSLYV